MNYSLGLFFLRKVSGKYRKPKAIALSSLLHVTLL